MDKNITNQNAETGTTTLGNVVEEAYSLNVKMEQAIIKVVNENGGFVRATPDCETMFGYVYDDESKRIEERRILALTTLKENNRLCILLGNDYDMYMLDGITKDKILCALISLGHPIFIILTPFSFRG